MASKDYYSILGVNRNADENEIKSAFRKLSLMYHPDRQKGKTETEIKEAEEKFKEVAEAYSVLSDKEKKKQYDMYGTVGDQGFSTMDVNDIFEHFRRNSGFNPFSDFFNEGRENRNVIKKGKNIKLNVSVTLQEIYNNSKKSIVYERSEPCSHCGGSGMGIHGKIETCTDCYGTGMITHTYRNGISIIRQSMPCPKCGATGKIITNPCHYCNGSGLERKKITKTIQIPIGCVDGSYMTIAQGGNYCKKNEGQIGDLIVIFKVEEDDNFEIMDDASSIATLKEVSVIDCILGGDQYIEAIDGKMYKFKLKPSTIDGSVYTLRGKGMPKENGDYGDMNVYIKQTMPSCLTKEDIKLLNKLKESKSFK